MKGFFIVLSNLLLLGIVVVKAEFPPKSCGISHWVNGKIVGGNEAEPGKWPWQVYMQIVQTNSELRQQCGGILISKRWVLSAAHCTIGLQPDEIRLVLGEHNIELEEEHSVDHAVALIVNHPNYTTFPITSNDISLLKLAGEAKFSTFIHPICLPVQGQRVAPGSLCWVTGWGVTEDVFQDATALREAVVPIINTTVCQETFADLLQDFHICVSHKDSGVSPCYGDSGGPLFCQDNSTSPFVVRGVTSFGRVCTGHAVYARVSEFIDWIDETIENTTGADPFFSIPQKPCGSVIENDELFRLPVNNYTQLYHPNLTCTWTVKPNANVTRVFFLFTEKFVVQTGVSTCSDYVQIVTDNGNRVHAELCGHFVPKGVAIPVDDKTTAINVTFVSDGSKQFEGFALNVTFNYDVVTANCTPTFITVNETGISSLISTPGYPSPYFGNDYNCYYQFEANPGYLVMLRIDVITEQCCDYIEFFDGNSSLGKLQGYLQRQAVISKTNILRLQIVTDFSIESVRFSAYYTQFKQTCGEDLTSTSTIQNFTSPDYIPTTTNSSLLPSTVPLMSDVTKECLWTITAMPGKAVGFLLHNSQMTSSSDWLIVYQNSTILAEYSYISSNRGSVVSTSNQIQVASRLVGGMGNGFSAGYFSTESCSVESFKLEGTSSLIISSPGYPFATARSLVCYYKFHVQANHFLVISFEGDLGPCCDFIELFDEKTYLGGYQSSLSDVVVASSMTVTMVYVTYSVDYSANSIGFQVTINQFDNTCGGKEEAKLSTQFITSPGFPEAYSTNQNCYWLITALRHRHVLLLIHHLTLNDGDSLELNTEGSFTAKLTGRNNESKTFVSLDEIFRIRFATEIEKNSPKYPKNAISGNDVGTGFNLSYTLITNTKNICSTNFFNLSGNKTGVIMSPNYPLPSPNDLNCTYEFEAESGYKIEILLHFDTEECCNYIEVIEDNLIVQRLQGKASGTRVISQTNRLKLVYYTDFFFYSNGFEGAYRQFKPFCGETLQATNQTKTFSSPTDLTSNNLDQCCLWTLNGVSDQKMHLTITSDDLEDDTFLLEINSGVENSILISNSSSFPLSTAVTSNRITVRFCRYSNATKGSFIASYAIAGICGPTQFHLSGNVFGIMSSPNYPYNSLRNLNCFYEFHAEPGYNIEITVEGRTESYYDYIEVYDGSVNLGRMDGIIRPTTIISSGESITIYYYTDSIITYEGFQAKYRQINLTCGSNLIASLETQNLTFSGQFVVSPSFPCIWFIIAPTDDKIFFNISNIEDGVIQVIDGLEITSNVTSSNALPFSFISNKALLQIRYDVRNLSGSSGFSASYYTSDKCSNACDPVNGECYQSWYGYNYCICKYGFSGNGYNCTDRDECKEYGSWACGANAYCTNEIGNYSCNCMEGYVGNGYTCNAVFSVSATLDPAFQYTPDLQNKSSEAYMNLSRLVTEQLEMKYGNNTVRVMELQFYKGSVVVIALLEVLNNLNVTDVQELFNNTIGDSLFKETPSTDINPCIVGPCGINEGCRNISKNEHICTCSEGYINSTGTCKAITCDDCSSFASCNQTSTPPVRCVCNPGFTGDGLVCVDIDECSSSSDRCPNAACFNSIGSFMCRCNPETYNRSGVCIPQCETGYCLNGATCVERNFVGNPACLCMEGYKGPACEEKIEEDPRVWIAIGVVAGVVFILLIMVVIMMIRLCRN